jgi:26S proteasome regulatory subunit N11
MIAQAQARQAQGGQPRPDTGTPDNGEVIHISSLALLKMLKHGRAGVPMEVMGLMLGEFVDDYTVQVIDVFAMPQSGTTVTVESVDHVFQTKMMEMLKQTGRPEMVVGCITHTLVLVVGCPVSISTRSSHSNPSTRGLSRL